MGGHCTECGGKTKQGAKFCAHCGYKLVVTDIIEDKEGHIRKAQEVMEAESPVDVPKKLTLMPGERLLERHLDFYVTDKRIIKHDSSVFSTKTTDYHYRHVKGVHEDERRPFLVVGLIVGIIVTIVGTAAESLFFILLGVFFIFLAFWMKKTELVVMHMDGGHIRIPSIKSSTGQKVANVVRTQLYNK